MGVEVEFVGSLDRARSKSGADRRVTLPRVMICVAKMSTKSLPKRKLPEASELSEKEAGAWIAVNKGSINRDLSAARKRLRAGQCRQWDFSKFVARARKRSAAKKKK